MAVKCRFSEAIVPRLNSLKKQSNEFYIVQLAKSGLCYYPSCPGEFSDGKRAKEFCRYFLEKEGEQNGK